MEILASREVWSERALGPGEACMRACVRACVGTRYSLRVMGRAEALVSE